MNLEEELHINEITPSVEDLENKEVSPNESSVTENIEDLQAQEINNSDFNIKEEETIEFQDDILEPDSNNIDEVETLNDYENNKDEDSIKEDNDNFERTPNKHTGLKIAGICALSACFGLAGGYLGSQIGINNKTEEQIMQSFKVNATTVSSTGAQDLTDVSEIASNSMPSIVAITSQTLVNYGWGFNTQTYETPASGSGVIYSQTEDYLFIVTNYHVIQDTVGLSVSWFDGTTSDAEIQGYSEADDIALIKVPISEINENTLNNLKIATIGNSDNCIVGQGTIAIGNALGYGQSVTTGIVSALNREVTFSDGNTLTMLQTSAAINPGNSGGALLNSKGELIGINSAKYSDTSVEGVGYAIPINHVVEVVQDILDGKINQNTTEENTVRLGITGYDVTTQMSQLYNMPTGVCIQSVDTGSPADNAGLLSGDIIVGLNDININTISQLKSIIEGLNFGDTIRLKIERPGIDNYEELEVKITF